MNVETYMINYNKWLSFQKLDSDLKEKLSNLTKKEIEDCFYKSLEFGTGGLRALLGVGPNRLNIYTVRKNTEGFARYIKSKGNTACEKGIVIAYDNRHMSKEFASEAAKVLAVHNIHSYVFESLRPTPELSFAVRELQAFGGIVITASHNPKEYNGYKVYNSKGGQCIPDETDIIIKYINSVEDELSVQVADEDTFRQYYHVLSSEIDEKYYNKLLETIPLNKDEKKDDFKIVFSPQHGTANIPVRTVLSRLGYKVILVENQCSPDPDFSNTLSPNPENEEAYSEGIKIAKSVDANLVMTTDPDCDRLGIAVKHNGEYRLLTGNQTGAILLDYILKVRKEKGLLPSNSIVFNTIVTSDLGSEIAKKFGIEVESTLTGFKFIGDKIREYEETGVKQFLFGYEESYGYLLSDISRDKDAVQSCMIIAEIANYYHNRGKTMIDILNNIYEEFGYYLDHLYSVTLKGIDGKERINRIMKNLREEKRETLGSLKVKAVEDYIISKREEEGIITRISLPKSNVLKFILEDNSWVAVRPSGTEPKCKFYFCIRGKNEKEANRKLIEIKEQILSII